MKNTNGSWWGDRAAWWAACLAFALGGCGGGGYGGGMPQSYTIGGTITGLRGAGLVLTNGSDTVSPAPGATSFTFATPVASGMPYAVAVKTPPKGEVCDVRNDTGSVSGAPNIWRRIRMGTAGLEGVECPSKSRSYRWGRRRSRSYSEGFFGKSHG